MTVSFIAAEDESDRVAWIQQTVHMPEDKQDGHMGSATRAATLRFQKAQGLKADGVVGPATLDALVREYNRQRCAMQNGQLVCWTQ
jgi:murein L,D-transpeptidase YcbB/YkuD